MKYSRQRLRSEQGRKSACADRVRNHEPFPRSASQHPNRGATSRPPTDRTSFIGELESFRIGLPRASARRGQLPAKRPKRRSSILSKAGPFFSDSSTTRRSPPRYLDRRSRTGQAFEAPHLGRWSKQHRLCWLFDNPWRTPQGARSAARGAGLHTVAVRGGSSRYHRRVTNQARCLRLGALVPRHGFAGFAAERTGFGELVKTIRIYCSKFGGVSTCRRGMGAVRKDMG